MPRYDHQVRQGTSGIFATDYIARVPTNAGGSGLQWLGGVRYEISGANLTQTGNSSHAVHGVYNITGTNAGTMPKAAIVGEIHGNTNTADAVFMAVMGSDTGSSANQTTVSALYGVQWQSNWGQVQYGLDLGPSAVSGQSVAPFYSTSDIRLQSQQVIRSVTTAITANSTTTTLPNGSIGITSNATGVGKLFMSDGSKWQFAVVA